MLLSDRPGPSRTAYVVKMYPRFSETFIVTEILAREAQGEDLRLFSLRPPVDPRFHPELARVQAGVTYIAKPSKILEAWGLLGEGLAIVPGFGDRFARMLPGLLAMDPIEAHQGVGLAAEFVRQGITHAHAHFGSMATRATAIAAELVDIPFSFTAHAKDIFHEEVDPAVLADLMRRAHHVVTVSDFNHRFLDRVSAGEDTSVHRVYNGLELRRFPYRDPAPRGTVLRVCAVGRLVEKKGFPYLLEAVARLKADGFALEVRIAGGGPQYGDLLERVGALDLADDVTLLGPKTQEEVVALLRWADVFVAPCVVAEDGNMDGLPTVLLEAMATGVPCIASDVTGISEVFDSGDGVATGILTRAGSTADLVRALAYCASADLTWMARAARQLIESSFDSVEQARRLRELQDEESTRCALSSSRAS
ncbi:glycosyltransferase involved in cell wall biosynthesis [Arthrobacter sp. CAN_A2]|uniref:glycosyltransferase n=1 Tax=Arthrobacter sp. CAN_A2 TaxID=2787718 RepID=UPI0018EFD08B